MTNEILKAEGEKLSQLLGKVLQPEKNKHTKPTDIDSKSGYAICGKCGKDIYYFEWDNTGPTEAGEQPCTVPDPIPLDDWNVAMKWRDWAVAEYGKGIVAQELTMAMVNDDISLWANEVVAQPKHYLQAAAICKLNAEKE